MPAAACASPGDATTFARIKLLAHRFELPAAFMLAFDEATFNESDFHRHRLERPPSIARSVPKRQAAYLAGRRVALAALQEAGAEATDLPIGADQAPIWPHEFIGSISHVCNIAVAIALRRTAGMQGVGVDLEYIVSPHQMGAIRELAIDAREYDVLSPLATMRGWPYALTLAFSAKESFFKATSVAVGSFFDFSALRIRACDPMNAFVHAEIVDTLTPRLPAGQEHALHWVDIGPGSLLTSCVW